MKILAFFILIFVIVSCSTQTTGKRTLDQKKAELYYNQGTKHLVGKKYSKALSSLLKAYKLNSKDTKVISNLAMSYYFKGRLDLAKLYLEKALDQDPKSSDARNNLASILFHRKEYSESEKHYKIILEDLIYEQQYRTHYNLGLVYLKQGRRIEAIKSIKLAASLKMDYCAANHKLGMMYRETSHYTEALKWLKKGMMGTCINEPEIQYQVALTLVDLNKFEQAEQAFRNINERFASTRYSTLATLKLREVYRNTQVGQSNKDLLKEKYFGKQNKSKSDRGSEEIFKSPSF